MPDNPEATTFRRVPAASLRCRPRALDKFIKRERLFVVHDNVFFNRHGDVICSGRGWTIRPE
jgi:3-hydroxybutyryl-CoA dehydratase